jgi:hypothetical protein
MSEERMMILKMLKDGKITADEAAKLLEAIGETKTKAEHSHEDHETEKVEGKFFRVKITDATTGKIRTNIRIPLSVMGAGAKFGARFTPQIEGLEEEDIMRLVRSGEVGKIIDLFDDEDGEHTEIYIE